MATQTWTGGGADNLASTALNWSTAAPTTGDTVVFDGAFPVTGNKNCTFDIADSFASINSTGYTGTITQSAATITITAGLTLANSTFAHGSLKFIFGAGTYSVDAGTAGNSFNNLEFKAFAGATVTLSNDITVVGTLDLAASNGNSLITINGNDIFAQGNVICTDTARVAGTTVLNFTGGANQSWSSNQDSRSHANELDIIINKSANTLTMSGTLWLGGAFTYTAGTVAQGTSHVKIASEGTFAETWTTSGMSFYDVSALNFLGTTVTLGSNMAVSNNLELSNSTGGSAVTWTGAYTITVSGNTTITQTSGGTCDMNGGISVATTGNFTLGAGTLLCGSGTWTINGNFTKSGGTFTAETSRFTFNGTSTLNGGVTFYNLTINSAKTVHLTSTQTFVVGASGTFTATSCTLDAVTGGSRANLTVSGSQSVSSVTATDIDSSAGNTVVNTSGTNSNTVNWTSPAASTYKRNLVMMMGVG